MKKCLQPSKLPSTKYESTCYVAWRYFQIQSWKRSGLWGYLNPEDCRFCGIFLPQEEGRWKNSPWQFSHQAIHSSWRVLKGYSGSHTHCALTLTTCHLKVKWYEELQLQRTVHLFYGKICVTTKNKCGFACKVLVTSCTQMETVRGQEGTKSFPLVCCKAVLAFNHGHLYSSRSAITLTVLWRVWVRKSLTNFLCLFLSFVSKNTSMLN